MHVFLVLIMITSATFLNQIKPVTQKEAKATVFICLYS